MGDLRTSAYDYEQRVKELEADNEALKKDNEWLRKVNLDYGASVRALREAKEKAEERISKLDEVVDKTTITAALLASFIETAAKK